VPEASGVLSTTVAILFRREAAGEPFPGCHTQLGPPNVFMVDALDHPTILRHMPHDVTGGVVSDF
jgi:hypothetical protein